MRGNAKRCDDAARQQCGQWRGNASSALQRGHCGRWRHCGHPQEVPRRSWHDRCAALLGNGGNGRRCNAAVSGSLRGRGALHDNAQRYGHWETMRAPHAGCPTMLYSRKGYLTNGSSMAAVVHNPCHAAAAWLPHCIHHVKQARRCEGQRDIAHVCPGTGLTPVLISHLTTPQTCNPTWPERG